MKAHGYSVGFIVLPDFRDPASIMEFGGPGLAFLMASGYMDSVVNRYSISEASEVFRKRKQKRC